MSGTPTSGLQGHGVQPRAVGTGERLSPTQVQPEWTPEQKAAWERREAARKHWAGGRSYLEAVGSPAQQEADRAAQRDAEEARLRDRWPDPRQALRDSHARLRDARAALAHCRSVLVHADEMVEQKRAALDRVRAETEKHDDAAVAALKQEIGFGARPTSAGEREAGSATTLPAPSASTPVARNAHAPVTAERTLEARHDVELAERARDELAAAVTEAERTEQRALRAVAEAALACVLLRGIGVADEIAEAEQQLANLRRALWGIDRLWIDGKAVKLPGKIVAGLAGRIMAAGPWEATYKALLADPEAPLP